LASDIDLENSEEKGEGYFQERRGFFPSSIEHHIIQFLGIRRFLGKRKGRQIQDQFVQIIKTLRASNRTFKTSWREVLKRIDVFKKGEW